MIEIPRRRFLIGLAGLVAAPAIVRIGSLMPVKALPVAPEFIVEPLAGPERFWRVSWAPVDGVYRHIRVMENEAQARRYEAILSAGRDWEKISRVAPMFVDDDRKARFSDIRAHC